MSLTYVYMEVIKACLNKKDNNKGNTLNLDVLLQL